MMYDPDRMIPGWIRIQWFLKYGVQPSEGINQISSDFGLEQGFRSMKHIYLLGDLYMSS